MTANSSVRSMSVLYPPVPVLPRRSPFALRWGNSARRRSAPRDAAEVLRKALVEQPVEDDVVVVRLPPGQMGEGRRRAGGVGGEQGVTAAAASLPDETPG